MLALHISSRWFSLPFYLAFTITTFYLGIHVTAAVHKCLVVLISFPTPFKLPVHHSKEGNEESPHGQPGRGCLDFFVFAGKAFVHLQHECVGSHPADTLVCSVQATSRKGKSKSTNTTNVCSHPTFHDTGGFHASARHLLSSEVRPWHGAFADQNMRYHLANHEIWRAGCWL